MALKLPNPRSSCGVGFFPQSPSACKSTFLGGGQIAALQDFLDFRGEWD